MPRNLVPLKVTIRYSNRGHVYPAFESIPKALRANLPWEKYVDLHGGWHYDRLSGIGESDAFNPDTATWIGVFLAEEAFALNAAENLDDVDVMTEAEFQAFHDDRAHVREQPQQIDADYVVALRALKGTPAGTRLEDDPTLTQDEIDALNPAHPSVGVRTNPRRKWVDNKARIDAAIDPVEVARVQAKVTARLGR